MSKLYVANGSSPTEIFKSSNIQRLRASIFLGKNTGREWENRNL